LFVAAALVTSAAVLNASVNPPPNETLASGLTVVAVRVQAETLLSVPLAPVPAVAELIVRLLIDFATNAALTELPSADIWTEPEVTPTVIVAATGATLAFTRNPAITKVCTPAVTDGYVTTTVVGPGWVMVAVSAVAGNGIAVPRLSVADTSRLVLPFIVWFVKGTLPVSVNETGPLKEAAPPVL
jgi:hypothetical protein